MYNRFKSVLLVALQFLFILLLILKASFSLMPVIANILIALSAILVFWAFAAMQKSKLRILPDPSPDAVLITSGPYRYIRHPMYTAILVGCSGLLITNFNLFSVVCIISLAIVLIIKLFWEEKMLSQKFNDYDNYMKLTSRLFPFIF